RRLVDVAMGRADADLVITNGKWVCVQSGEIIPDSDIAISDGRIAYVGESAAHTIGDNTEIIDADGRYLVPGLLDAHMHVESGMVTVTEFVRAVARRGTTGIFIDPHEIANVFGLRGVKLMVDEAAEQPIHVWVQIPSCVPSSPGLETSGAHITPKDVAEAMTWEGIIGLGEMMDFPNVIRSVENVHLEMAETVAADKTIGGHYASPDLGIPFHGYAAGGAEDDHEGTNIDDAIARVRQGMKTMLRYGSAWHDVAAQVKAVTEKKLDSRHFMLCTDDSHAQTLIEEGHMDRVLRHAIEQGLEPITAIQMATINTAEHFKVARDIGQIAPGRYADILMVSDLHNFKAELVISKGRIIAKDGKLLVDMPSFKYPDWAVQSVHLGRQVEVEDFKIRVTGHQSKLVANAIGIIENQAPTEHLKIEITPVDDEICVDLERDILKIALVERHSGTGNVTVGLVHGFGFTERCAVATTVAHDSHHMIVVGSDEAMMVRAVDVLAECGGGQVVVKDGRIIGQVELPIAGLISNERAEIVAEKTAGVLSGFQACGCKLNNPNMQLSLLALVVIPELRISDLGLVDVNNFEFIPVVEDNG
ncbi:adenine deaminase, partial [Chloroflexota bacterium]